MKGYILVEGHGETKAAHNLVTRIAREQGCPLPWSPPLRWKNLHQWEPRSGKGGIRRGIEFIRAKPDATALLILRDEDDGCPKDIAPEISRRIAGLQLDLPIAFVLLHPEFEVLFLPCLDLMKTGFGDGRPGVSADAEWHGESWESRRGIKEWLSKHFPTGKSYKPTLDQLRMTQRLDLQVLRDANVPCFGSLERGIRTLCESQGKGSTVYP